ncbi:MAG: radical SAM protein [Gammaproteobacteria bacterium]
MASKLTTTDHNRDIAGLTYIYPVLSRRSGGISIGINFNINNACNWRCLYCQVPDLKIGAAPQMNFELLSKELTSFLDSIVRGDFYGRYQIPEELRAVKDIAISGNGEPTALANFAEAVDLIGKIATEKGVFPGSRFVLITNGSLIHLPKVQEGLLKLSQYGGEVWFKLDSATKAGRRLINNTKQNLGSSLNNLFLSSRLCRTKLQTCLVDIDNKGFPEEEREALLDVLALIRQRSAVRHLMLYTIARPSLQAEAERLRPLAYELLNAFADEIRLSGFEVTVNV